MDPSALKSRMEDANDALVAKMASFYFLEGMDQADFDMDFESMDLVKCAEFAYQRDDCVAFNSLGFTKSRVHRLTRPSLLQEGRGMFVKWRWVERVALGGVILSSESCWTADDAKRALEAARYLRSWNHQVEFTSDWFSINISSWIRHVPVLFCKTGLRVLEIGSYEGRSALWMANRVVRGAEARIDCVDTWEGSVEHSIHGETLKSRFMKNLAPFLGKTVFMHQGASKDVLVKMLAEGGGKYDVAYVDASHFAKDCLVDMVLAYELLKVGGYMIVDDYCEHPVMERHWYPKMAVDAFVAIYKDRMVKVNQNNQFILKKICDSSLYERERLYAAKQK